MVWVSSCQYRQVRPASFTVNQRFTLSRADHVRYHRGMGAESESGENPCNRAGEAAVLTGAMAERPIPSSLPELLADHRKRKREAAAETSQAEVCEAICEFLADGWSIGEISRKLGIRIASIHAWALGNGEEQYARARQVQAMAWADELLTIADDGRNDWMARNDPDNPGYDLNGEHVQRSRVRIDTRKFLLTKILPKVYGDAGAGRGEGSTSFVFNFPANASPAQLQAVANLAKSGLTPKALPGVPIDVQASPAK